MSPPHFLTIWRTSATNGLPVYRRSVYHFGAPPQISTDFASWLRYISWAGTLYIHFGGFCPLTEFWHVQNSLCVQVLRSRILTALLHGTPAAASAKLCSVVQGMELRNFRRKRHLYSAGRPSRWASAHILVNH